MDKKNYAKIVDLGRNNYSWDEVEPFEILANYNTQESGPGLAIVLDII